MKCQHCGKKNNSSNIFCSVCGEMVSNNAINHIHSHEPLPENINQDVTVPLPRYNPSKEKNPKKRIYFIFLCSLWILLVISVILFLYFGFIYIKKVYQSNIVNNTQTNYRIVVTKIDQNGHDAHKFMINGVDGDIVSIQGYKEEYVIKEGTAQIIMDDLVWVKQNNNIEKNANSITIKKVAKITRKSGSIVMISIPPFIIQIPIAPFELLNPTTANIDTTEANYLFKCKVELGSKIFINGNNYSDIIDKNGIIQVNMIILPVGINKILVIVELNGYQKMNTTVLINRAPMDIEISLDNLIPSVINTSEFPITGKTEPGASISVNLPVKESLKINPATGSFKFSPKFNGFGKQTIVITASKENKSDSILSIQTYYLPSADEYTKSAYKLNYSLLLKNANSYKNKVFLCVGMISDIQQNNGVGKFMFYVNENKQEIIHMEYIGNMVLKENTNYRIYGDVIGYDHQYPFIIARYIYEKK